jgi:hypothetical protein
MVHAQQISVCLNKCDFIERSVVMNKNRRAGLDIERLSLQLLVLELLHLVRGGTIVVDDIWICSKKTFPFALL